MPQPSDESFPGPVPLPRERGEQRGLRTQRLMRVALIGVAVRLLIVAAELIAYLWFRSSTLLVDALASGADVLASLLLIAAIWLAAKPPDEEHPFGHGRYEPLAGWQLAVLLALFGLYLFGRQLYQASVAPVSGDLPAAVAIIPGLATILLEVVSRIIRSFARRHRSSALLAEAAHFRIDAITSGIATIGIVAAAIVPAVGGLVDHLGAMVLAVVMIGLGIHASLENLHQLMDRVPEETSFQRVRQAAISVAGVKEIEKIRLQHAGPDAHVDIDIEVDPALRLDEAHRIAQHVRAAIQADWPSVREVVVHVEPYFEGDH